MTAFYPVISAAFAKLLPELIRKPAVVVGHARPDGDCIGSQVALARVLRAQGCPEVRCLNLDPVPRRLEFLNRSDAFDTLATLPPGITRALFVDCADHLRPGPEIADRFPRPFLNVDHHVSNNEYAETNFVHPASAATCEILTGVFLDNGLPIDAITAQALYVGVVTDTGQFRFGSTTQRTFEMAAALVAHGADPASAGFELYERESAGKLQLLQRFLASFQSFVDGRVCIGFLPDGVFAETDTSVEDTEGLVDYARAIDGVDVGALIEERGDAIKVSLRSHNPAYRMDRVAAAFGGGGHACAAGLNLKGVAAEDVRVRLVEALTEVLASADRGASVE